LAVQTSSEHTGEIGQTLGVYRHKGWHAVARHQGRRLPVGTQEVKVASLVFPEERGRGRQQSFQQTWKLGDGAAPADHQEISAVSCFAQGGRQPAFGLHNPEVAKLGVAVDGIHHGPTAFGYTQGGTNAGNIGVQTRYQW
jgi:hypothetical protein